MTFDSIRQKAIDEQKATSFPDVQVNSKGEPCLWPFRRSTQSILHSMLDDMRRGHSSLERGLSQKKKRHRRRGPRVLVASNAQGDKTFRDPIAR
jgi:hypothetical protein